MTQVEFQQSKPQAPDITGITVIITAIGVGVKAFRTHVGTSAHIGVAGIQRTAHDFADTKVCNLHFHLVVHQEIRGLDVTVDDLVPV